MPGGSDRPRLSVALQEAGQVVALHAGDRASGPLGRSRRSLSIALTGGGGPLPAVGRWGVSSEGGPPIGVEQGAGGGSGPPGVGGGGPGEGGPRGMGAPCRWGGAGSRIWGGH